MNTDVFDWVAVGKAYFEFQNALGDTDTVVVTSVSEKTHDIIMGRCIMLREGRLKVTQFYVVRGKRYSVTRISASESARDLQLTPTAQSALKDSLRGEDE